MIVSFGTTFQRPGLVVDRKRIVGDGARDLIHLADDPLSFQCQLLFTQFRRLFVHVVDETTFITGRKVSQQTTIPVDYGAARNVFDVDVGVERDAFGLRRIRPFRSQRLGPMNSGRGHRDPTS